MIFNSRKKKQQEKDAYLDRCLENLSEGRFPYIAALLPHQQIYVIRIEWRLGMLDEDLALRLIQEVEGGRY